MKQSILKDKSKAFALRIFKLYNYLGTTKHEYVMAKQLLRSGTSIGANIAEAFYGQSDADFISKLSLSQKECAETLYWLDLLHESNMIEEAPFQSIYTDATELMKLLTSSIKTMKAKHLTLNTLKRDVSSSETAPFRSRFGVFSNLLTINVLQRGLDSSAKSKKPHHLITYN